MQIQIPGNTGISNVQARRSEIGIKEDSAPPENDRIVFIGLKSATDQILVTLKNNIHLEMNVQLIFQTPIIIEEGCDELGLKILQKSKKDLTSNSSIPFYLAYKCEKISSGIRLAVTAPMDMSWVSNSLLESLGKGKNWKNFELGLQLNNFNRQEIGSIEFEWQKNHYLFDILIEKTEIIRPISAFVFSPGVISVNLKTSEEQQTITKPATLVLFELRPLGPNFSFGGQGLISIPAVSASSYFHHTETMGYLGYALVAREKRYFEPRGYFHVLNGVIKSMNQFYISSNFAVGGVIRYDLSQRNQVAIESFFATQSSQNIFSMRFLYSRKNMNRIGGWGIAFIYQTFGLKLSSEEESHGRQIYVGPIMEF